MIIRLSAWDKKLGAGTVAQLSYERDHVRKLGWNGYLVVVDERNRWVTYFHSKLSEIDKLDFYTYSVKELEAGVAVH